MDSTLKVLLPKVFLLITVVSATVLAQPKTSVEYLLSKDVVEWTSGIEAHSEAGTLYEPKAEHFRSRYDVDHKNRAVQKWTRTSTSEDKQYWDWVKTFYEEDSGWTVLAKSLLAKAPSSAHAKLIPLLNKAGRIIASDWSKNNDVRRIDTFPTLAVWKNALVTARDADLGDGKKIKASLDKLWTDVLDAITEDE
jgi:hypothetical protein